MLANLLAHFDDASVTEVCCNGVRTVAIFRGSEQSETPSPFTCPHSMTRWLQDFCFERKIRLDPLQPCNGGILDGVYRWHAVIAPVAVDGPLFNVRRHRFREIGLTRWNLLPSQLAAVRTALHSAGVLLVCGPTGSGKSTFLAAALNAFCSQDRVLILEDIPELPLLQPRWARLTSARPNLDGLGAIGPERLFTEALRLRPDRIVVGEVRDTEGAALVQGLFSGHGNIATTLHAQSASAALERLAWITSRSLTFAPTLRRLFCEAGGCVIVMVQRGIHGPQVVSVSQLHAGEWESVS